MNNQKSLITVGIVLGVVFFIIGYIYATHSAGSLPAFFPGHTVGDSHTHVKHSMAAFVVGITCFVFAWFKSGPKAT